MIFNTVPPASTTLGIQILKRYSSLTKNTLTRHNNNSIVQRHAAAATRTYLSATIEPPLTSTIIEKPCTVLLLEDRAIYKNDLWTDSFHTSIPIHYGMSFVSVTFPSPQGDGDDENKLEFNQMLQELKEEVSPLNDAILIARGPISSWCAMFYLESCSLQGLIMVDPILLERRADKTMMDAIAKLQTNSAQSTDDDDDDDDEGEGWNRLLQGAKERNLLLEPGVVPMLVLYNDEDEACERAARRVAKRHSGGEGARYGDVLVKPIPRRRRGGGDTANHGVMTEIDDWIESIL